eukprot:1907795-Rhodomonas_salina.1
MGYDATRCEEEGIKGRIPLCDVREAMLLRPQYAVSGTDIGYAPTLSGTDVGYAPTRMQALNGVHSRGARVGSRRTRGGLQKTTGGVFAVWTRSALASAVDFALRAGQEGVGGETETGSGWVVLKRGSEQECFDTWWDALLLYKRQSVVPLLHFYYQVALLPTPICGCRLRTNYGTEVLTRVVQMHYVRARGTTPNDVQISERIYDALSVIYQREHARLAE